MRLVGFETKAGSPFADAVEIPMTIAATTASAANSTFLLPLTMVLLLPRPPLCASDPPIVGSMPGP
jgi:hypothetical protein